MTPRGTPTERIARMQRHGRTIAEGRNPDYSDHNTPKRLAVERPDWEREFYETVEAAAYKAARAALGERGL